jgi:hypothetical protein
MRLKTIGVAVGSAAVLAATLAAPAAASHHGRTIRYLSTNPNNTDIDLGEPGLSAGDVQAFTNDAVRNGKRIGYEAGECRIVLLDAPRLVAHCHSTLVLTHGTLTSQGVFEEDMSEGPKGLTCAITGGTGRFRGASGEGVGVFVANTDDVTVTVTLD